MTASHHTDPLSKQQLPEGNSLADSLPEIVFLDFDGVLTDNKVYVNELGQESVRCDRGDGLAINALQKLEIPVFIVSTETNPVVSQRAKKLKVRCVQGVAYKPTAIQSLAQELQRDLSTACYVGNDINDLRAMSLCHFRVAPADSHAAILDTANIVLQTKGGDGVLRELLEHHFKLDLIQILYPK